MSFPNVENGCVEGVCRHFGECGGCVAQDVPYEEQLNRKEAGLRELFGGLWREPIPVEPSPAIWHYRNKVDPVFGGKVYDEPPPKGFKREPVIGFKRRGRWFVTLDIEECRIAPEGFAELRAAVRGWARDSGLPYFNPRHREGFFRALLVREGKRTGDRMVVLITNEGEFDKDSFVKAVLSAYPATSIQRAVNRTSAQTAMGEDLEVLHGNATIDEVLQVPDGNTTRDLRFRISPFSFFQTNTLGTERLYGLIRQWARGTGARVLYDMYGGSGGIALTCADLVENVISVENVEAATLDGRHNAALNGIDNVTFLTATVEEYLRNLRDERGALEPDCAVVLDPPRAGLHPRALKRLLEMRPPHVLYVACKPETLAQQDLPPLAEQYELRQLRAVDLFPHTPHVEVIAELSAKGD